MEWVTSPFDLTIC